MASLGSGRGALGEKSPELASSHNPRNRTQMPPRNTRTSTAPKSSGYLTTSKNLFHSFLLVIPLFVLYQIGVLGTGGAVNGVDFTTRFLMRLFGGSVAAYLGFNVAVLVGLFVALKMLPQKEKLHAGVWAWVVVESAVYAFFLSGVIKIVLVGLLGVQPPLFIGDLSAGDKVIMSLGAGFYEELVFRLLLLSGIVWALKKIFAKEDAAAWVIGVVVSSFLFSAAHYVGAYGDAFTLYSFLFRFFAGVLFSILFRTRGFAVAVYTHAIYDIFVMVVFS